MKSINHCIVASQGLSLASASVIKNNLSNHKTDYSISSIEEEINSFKKAVELAKNKIQKIINNNDCTQELNDILSVQLGVLDDCTLHDEIIENINQNNNLIHSINMYIEKYRSIFSELNDPYLSERIKDIEDALNSVIKCHLNDDNQNQLTEPFIIIANDILPSQLLEYDKNLLKGIITEQGSITSHASIIANNLSIPMIIGAKEATRIINDGDFVCINSVEQSIKYDLNDSEIKDLNKQIEQYKIKKEELKKYIGLDVKSIDGKELLFCTNAGNLNDIKISNSLGSNNIGLFRTEFIFMESRKWPTSDEQFHIYKQIVENFNHPVTFRTIDIGADKHLDYYQFDDEPNPALGIRGIRFCLKNKNIFTDQLKALLKASNYGELKIMFPMITNIDELRECIKIYNETYDEINKEINIKNKPKLGIMIEVPSLLFNLEKVLKYVDFVSIGTNDLMQYTSAIDRMNVDVAYLNNPYDPYFIKILKLVNDECLKQNKECSICGHLASDYNYFKILCALGYKKLSMSNASYLENKSTFNSIDISKISKILLKAIDETETADELKQFLIQNGF